MRVLSLDLSHALLTEIMPRHNEYIVDLLFTQEGQTYIIAMSGFDARTLASHVVAR